MCLSIPAEVLSVHDNDALVSVQGMKIKVSSLLLNDLKPGDFILVHTGFAIQTISRKEAEETLQVVRHMLPPVSDGEST